MIMIIEQTKEYPNRMIYDPINNSFSSSDVESLAHRRHFEYPYGWIKESGTPPEPHCDSILMDGGTFELGEEINVKIIGMFKRNDGDHKYVVANVNRPIEDLYELTAVEWDALKRLYPRVDEGEGWFGYSEASLCYEQCDKAL